MSARIRITGVLTTFYATMVKAGSTDLAGTADWTPVVGDVKISRDGAAVVNIGTLPTSVTGTGSVLWRFTLSASEMSAAQLAIQVVDTAPKAVEDNTFFLEMIGSPTMLHDDAPQGGGAAI